VATAGLLVAALAISLLFAGSQHERYVTAHAFQHYVLIDFTFFHLVLKNSVARRACRGESA
jgi:hypothetical protein